MRLQTVSCISEITAIYPTCQLISAKPRIKTDWERAWRSSYNGKPRPMDSMPPTLQDHAQRFASAGHRFSWQWLVNDRQVAGISIRVDFEAWCAVVPRKARRRSGRAAVQTQTTLPIGRAAPLVHLPTVRETWRVLCAGSLAGRQCGGLGYARRSEASEGTKFPPGPTNCGVSAWLGRRF